MLNSLTDDDESRLLSLRSWLVNICCCGHLKIEVIIWICSGAAWQGVHLNIQGLKGEAVQRSTWNCLSMRENKEPKWKYLDFFLYFQLYLDFMNFAFQKDTEIFLPYELTLTIMAMTRYAKTTVDEKSAFKSIYKNKEYYFCSENCKRNSMSLIRVLSVCAVLWKTKRRYLSASSARDHWAGILRFAGHAWQAAKCSRCKRQARTKRTVYGIGYAITSAPYHNHRSKPYRECAWCLQARSLIPEVKGQTAGLWPRCCFMHSRRTDRQRVVTVKSDEEPETCSDSGTDKRRSPALCRSIYVHSLTMESLMSAIKRGSRSIGFVGPSCNIDAVYKMQNSPYVCFTCSWGQISWTGLSAWTHLTTPA